ncbi:abhydrolase domain containing 13-like protein Bem46 [Leptinotarsa decemlineata]|uniref:abhydrolase domain containing 13-like protein Bem46 n=1 Tax=Leptinotarsa decemlineata TaxID=7539 RepID=UPI003D30668F
MGRYLLFSRISATLFRMVLRVWAYSGLVLVFCFLVYYMYGGIFAILLLSFAVTGILYQVQDNLIYTPELPNHSRVFVPIPSTFNLPHESIMTKTADGTQIHMYFIHQPKEKQRVAPTIIFFHGNAGNMGHRLQNCVGLYHNLHCNILLVEYRGYGLSEGSPSEEGLYMDARASIDYLYSRNDIIHSAIIVFGRSLGGAVAIDLATRKEYAGKIWCLIVENTFTSIPHMAKVLLGWRILQYFPLFFYKNKFVSYQKVKELRVPTLFISGLADTLVPPQMMKELHMSCSSSRKNLLQIPAGTHNETWQIQGYYRSLAVFLQSCRLENNIKKDFDIKVENEKTQSNSLWNNVQTI